MSVYVKGLIKQVREESKCFEYRARWEKRNVTLKTMIENCLTEMKQMMGCKLRVEWEEEEVKWEEERKAMILEILCTREAGCKEVIDELMRVHMLAMDEIERKVNGMNVSKKKTKDMTNLCTEKERCRLQMLKIREIGVHHAEEEEIKAKCTLLMVEMKIVFLRKELNNLKKLSKEEEQIIEDYKEFMREQGVTVTAQEFVERGMWQDKQALVEMIELSMKNESREQRILAKINEIKQGIERVYIMQLKRLKENVDKERKFDILKEIVTKQKQKNDNLHRKLEFQRTVKEKLRQENFQKNKIEQKRVQQAKKLEREREQERRLGIKLDLEQHREEAKRRENLRSLKEREEREKENIKLVEQRRVALPRIKQRNEKTKEKIELRKKQRRQKEIEEVSRIEKLQKLKKRNPFYQKIIYEIKRSTQKIQSETFSSKAISENKINTYYMHTVYEQTFESKLLKKLAEKDLLNKPCVQKYLKIVHENQAKKRNLQCSLK
eukprot:augustus_masked-scaffold_65-processed-gene-0.53-mRNA-1 protein AED:1.00 eAED:1.00 QI:0/-1/0/0/-1/1/1/0/493